MKSKVDLKFLNSIKSLGPVKYLKTNFCKNTLNKFREVNGKFFGCLV